MFGAWKKSSVGFNQRVSENERFPNPHHFWTHFAFGFTLGAGAGAWIGFTFFDLVAAIIVTAATSLIAALCAGKWGDEFWAGVTSLFR
jgi:hypothetical protein